ncbi:unnamed protein product [Hydatigera taeniaeformis]|uniref:Uncharacterized protein n=1 Tax=Hydatigena taeniaeformis TaxID=6205 RepID=A0A0R3WRV6_HYDTA|nr:unnamed protein product [Hydatigera taeniaeformis]
MEAAAQIAAFICSDWTGVSQVQQPNNCVAPLHVAVVNAVLSGIGEVAPDEVGDGLTSSAVAATEASRHDGVRGGGEGEASNGT